MELQPKEGMLLLKCPYKCKGDFEGGMLGRSKPICNNLIGHAFLERVVKDMIADATARLRMNNQAAVYINDEKCMGASKSFHTDTGRTSDPGKATIRTYHKRTPESDIQRCPFSYGYRTQPEAFSNYQRQTAPAAVSH